MVYETKGIRDEMREKNTSRTQGPFKQLDILALLRWKARAEPSRATTGYEMDLLSGTLVSTDHGGERASHSEPESPPDVSIMRGILSAMNGREMPFPSYAIHHHLARSNACRAIANMGMDNVVTDLSLLPNRA